MKKQTVEAKALGHAPLFRAVPKRHRRRIAALADIRHFDEGTIIVRAGEPGDDLYILLDGEVDIEAQDGAEHHLGAGDHFGELSLIDGKPRTATARAACDATAGCIEHDDFRALLVEEPDVAVGLLPGLVLIARDLLRADAQGIPDHGSVEHWRADGGAETELVESEGRPLKGRDALGWLMLLRHVGVFSALNEKQLRHIARFFTIERYGDGDMVVSAGAKGDALYIVLNGRARVRTPSGHTRPLGQDDAFGELALIDGAPRAATVSAVGELTAARLDRADFRKLLKAEPGMAVGLVDGLASIIRDLQPATV